ncbi:MAG TPA: STAS domain-containing protein [Blastocatellia bacterium]|nr:STAS domain-containing protein [Blastocatellia bacterium]
MLKITESAASDGTAMLYLEGQINGPWLTEISRCCDRILATARRLTLDLANVSFVDRDAVALFRKLKDREVTITNCSPFVAEQLKGLGLCGPAETPDQAA